MDRIVYCPEALPIEHAYELANTWMLPIQHGDSERTEEMEFDRNAVQVLHIPITKGFQTHFDKFFTNQPIMVFYTNDWIDVSTCKFFLRPKGVKNNKKWEVPSMINDAHRATMNISVTFPGVYELFALKDGAEIDSIDINASDIFSGEDDS